MNNIQRNILQIFYVIMVIFIILSVISLLTLHLDRALKTISIAIIMFILISIGEKMWSSKMYIKLNKTGTNQCPRCEGFAKYCNCDINDRKPYTKEEIEYINTNDAR